jgi:hypothetical protein
MRNSAPSLVRRAHNNHHFSSVPSHPPTTLDTCAASTLDDRHHHSRHGDFHHTASAAKRSISSSWNLFFIKSKKAWTGRMFTYTTTLCIVFLMSNLISMGKINMSPSFRRAHSSSSNSSPFFSTYSFDTLHSNQNNLRSHVQRPHSILLFSGHSYGNSTSRPSSSASSIVLPTPHRIRSKNKTANFGLLEIEMLPKSRFQRSIQNETDADAATTDNDMKDRIAIFMTGWDDSSDAQRVSVSKPENKSSTTGLMDAQQKDCQRVSWHKVVYPNCNTFHEFGLATVLLDETTAYIGYVATLPCLFESSHFGIRL